MSVLRLIINWCINRVYVRCSVVESEKASVQKELSDVRGSLRDVETSRAELHAQWKQTRRELSAAENERNALNDKLSDLRAGLSQADDTLQSLTKDNFDLKQKVDELFAFSSLKCSISDRSVNS